MAPPRKVTFEQTNILAEFVKTHKHIALGRFGSVQGLKEARRAWESVAVRLNANGIKRTPHQWRRYWIEYKAKLKSKAADSRRTLNNGPRGRLRPLSDQEKQFLVLMKREADFDTNVSATQDSTTPKETKPEVQPNSLKEEWLNYDSECDEQQGKEDTDGSLSVDSHSDSDSLYILQSAADSEDEVAGNLMEQRTDQEAPYTNRFKNAQNSASLPQRLKSYRMRKLYKDQRNGLKDDSRFFETKSMLNISSRPSASIDQQEVDNKLKRASRHLKEHKSAETQDQDILFFHSILPEMKQMNPDQKRQFKMGIWSLASQILNSNSMDSPSDHNYGIQQRR